MVIIKEVVLPNGVVIREIVLEDAPVQIVSTPKKKEPFLKRFSNHVLKGFGAEFTIF